MSEREFKGKAAAVPSGRIGRLARLGGMAARIAGGAALGALEAGASGRRPRLEDLLLTPGNAARIASRLGEMRGAAMKVGQLMSMEAGDLLPSDFAAALGRLRAEADFMPPAQLKRVLAANWGPDFIRHFDRFDVTPIAAASIGQVHRAWTKDGRALAVKVQYPGVRASIDSDVANVAGLIKMAGVVPRGLDLSHMLEAAKAQLHEEADYLREAALLEAYRAQIGASDEFRVPAVHADLSTADILAMDYVAGAPIETLETAPQAARDRATRLLFALFLREIFRFGLVQTDANFANYRYDPDSRAIILLDFGATRPVSPAQAAASRDMMAAALSGARAPLARAAIEMGYFSAATAERHQRRVLDMIDMAAAPFRDGGLVDFGALDLAERLTRAGAELSQERDFTEIPPIETLLLQRKAAGLFLLARRLRARVDTRALADPYLAPEAAHRI